MSMDKSGQNRVLRLQKRIFKSLEKEAELLLGKPPQSIRKYELETLKDFRGSRSIFQSIAKTELIDSIRSSDVSLIADFHTFEQAQKTALRLAREAVQPGELWYLGLELVPSHFQSALDQYQADQISTEDFLEQISYSQEWGFPWSNYAPLIDWAKKNQVHLIALNRPRLFEQTQPSEDDLHQRDVWAAGIITDLFHHHQHDHPRPRMIVLYGELHVGNLHLPKQIKQVSRGFLGKPLSTVVIHQNDNQLYWRLAERGAETSTTITRLKKNTYCVFSSTPWTKLQSLVNWAEGGHTHAIHEELDDLGLISAYGKVLVEFLGIPECHYESLSTYRIDQTGFLENLRKQTDLSQGELRLIRQLVQQNQRFYLQNIGLAFLGTSASNGLAEIAAIHLLRSQTPLLAQRSQFFSKSPELIYKNIVDSAFGFFGSLVLNPKRKCDLVLDHIHRIEALRSGATPKDRQELTARILALEILEVRRGQPKLPESLRSAPLIALYWSTRYVGQIFGRHIFTALRSEKLSLEWVKTTFGLAQPESPGQKVPKASQTFELLCHQLSEMDFSASKHDHL